MQLLDVTNAPSGAALHYAVAVADGRLEPRIVGDECLIRHGGEGGPIVRFDEAWFQLQILPRESQRGLALRSGTAETYVAGYESSGIINTGISGATPIEAMMRAFAWDASAGEWPRYVPPAED